MANLAAVLKELEQERSRLDQAIEAIGSLVGRNHLRLVHAQTNRLRRTLSAAARRKIAAAQRARWAKVRAKQAKKVA
jgi:hypothetical protein